MTGTIKKRALSLLMALTVSVSAELTWVSVSSKANAVCSCTTLKSRRISNSEIENAISWACKLADAGAKGWNSKTIGQWTESWGWCTRFVTDAFYDGANLPKQGVNSAPHFLDVEGKGHEHRIYQGDPPRGAIALYTGGSDGWGHMAISLGDGRVVEGGNGKVQYNNLSLTMYVSKSTFTYRGYMWYGDMLQPESPPPLTISAPQTQDEVQTRINTIINGEYGDGKTFPYSNTPVPAELAGEAGETRTFGYARYAFYKIFGISISTGVKSNEYELANSNGNLKVIASCSGNSTAAQMKEDVFNAKPGDIIQGKGNGFYQTMIVVSYDENSVTILDCDNDYKCGILVRTRDWERFSGSFKQYTIYRSKNYPVKQEIETPSMVREGDINGDGKVDMTDITMMVAYYANLINKNDSIYSRLDYNKNGRFDFADITALLSDYANGRV